MTLYVDIPGSLRLWLRISEWLNERLEESQFGFLQGVPYGIWFNGDKEMAEQLVDFVFIGLKEHRSHIEVFDGNGDIVASSFPAQKTSVYPDKDGMYLCYVRFFEENYEWDILKFRNGEWLTVGEEVICWLHLPHYQQNLTKV